MFFNFLFSRQPLVRNCSWEIPPPAPLFQNGGTGRNKLPLLWFFNFLAYFFSFLTTFLFNFCQILIFVFLSDWKMTSPIIKTKKKLVTLILVSFFFLLYFFVLNGIFLISGKNESSYNKAFVRCFKKKRKFWKCELKIKFSPIFIHSFYIHSFIHFIFIHHSFYIYPLFILYSSIHFLFIHSFFFFWQEKIA